jgi:hypothetical protein
MRDPARTAYPPLLPAFPHCPFDTDPCELSPIPSSRCEPVGSPDAQSVRDLIGRVPTHCHHVTRHLSHFTCYV